MSSTPLRQPTLRVPYQTVLAERVVEFDAIGLRVRIEAFFQTSTAGFVIPIVCALDSGASVSIMSIELAESYRLPIPIGPELLIPTTTASGSGSMRVIPGRVRLWLNPNQEGYPYDWPMMFRVDGSLRTPPIIGLGGVVKTCRWTFSGEFSKQAPHGTVQLEDLR
jgi:hypothetical protein